jgi:hypothetical protein
MAGAAADSHTPEHCAVPDRQQGRPCQRTRGAGRSGAHPSKHGMLFFEVSAKDATNINKVRRAAGARGIAL